MQVFLNGQWLNESRASVSVNNRSFRYGDGCFETIRVCKGRVLLAEFHLDRLFTAISALGFEPPSYFSRDYIIDRIGELVNRNAHQPLARVRLTVFRGNGGLYDPENHFPNLLIQSWALNPAVLILNENGLVTGDYTAAFKAADALANLKSNNFLCYAMAALHAKKQHWNDALVSNHRGTYADATIANLWVVRENTVLTPPLTDGPVGGVMRRYLLEQLPALGLTVREASLGPADLAKAEEVFLSNAIHGIRWVKQHESHGYSHRCSQIIHQEILRPLTS